MNSSKECQLEQMSLSEACRNATIAQLEKLDLAVLQAEKTTGHEPHQLTNFQLLHNPRVLEIRSEHRRIY